MEPYEDKRRKMSDTETRDGRWAIRRQEMEDELDIRHKQVSKKWRQKIKIR